MRESTMDVIRSDYASAFAGDLTLLGFIYRFFFDPGFQSIMLYRLYSALYRSGRVGKIASKFFWRLSVSLNACYLMPGSIIGSGLYLPHPVGVVIGEGVVIGKNATIYQGVTIGVKRRMSKDYPLLGDNITLYVGSCVFGKVNISDSTTLNAYQVITSDKSQVSSNV